MKIRNTVMWLMIVTACFLCSCQSMHNEEIILYTETTTEETTEAETEQPEETQEQPQTITIHICGAVRNPGVYTLNEGCRVIDALEAAGGFDKDASEDYVNLAENLTDGCKVTIPTVEQATSQNVEEETAFSVITGQSTSQTGSGLVNINTADENMLLTLTGIGKVRAEQIITYREEHGPFQSIEDIMKVSGIKQASYEKFKDEITVK